MKYAITVTETKSKTFIVDSNNLDAAIEKIAGYDIDLESEGSVQEITVSEFANKDGTATEHQLDLCQNIEDFDNIGIDLD